MKESIWLLRLLAIGAVLETLAGLGFLAFPSPLVSLLLGESLSDAGLVVARIAGGGLLALAEPAPATRFLLIGASALHGLLALALVAVLVTRNRDPSAR